MSIIGDFLLPLLNPYRKSIFEKSNDFSNKTIIVTGASRGLGKILCLDALDNGAMVVAISKNGKRLMEAYKEINNKNLLLVEADITNEKDVQDAYKKVFLQFGNIDVLINNVGEYVGGNLETLTNHDFDNLVNTNLRGMFLMTRSALPAMKKKKSGLILNVSSRVAKKTNHSGRSLYAMTKAGIEGFSKALGIELKNTGVRVSCIMPGTMNTNMSLEFSKNLWPEEVSKLIITMIRLDRVDIESIVIKSKFSEK